MKLRPFYRFPGCALLVVFCVALVTEAASPLRTWTSVSGATVEAQFIGVERGELILRGADGNEFVIRADLLSEADQQYVREQLDIPVEPAPAAPAKTEVKPGELHADNIPGITLHDARFASFFGFQHGPQANDVVYFVLDRSSDAGTTDARDRLYRYRPGQPTPLETLRGRSRSHDGSQYLEFDAGAFTGQYDGIPGEHIITLLSGPERFDLIFAHIESTYGTGRNAVRVEMTGTLNNFHQVGPGEIPVITLHQGFRLSIRQARHTSDPNYEGDIVTHGDFYVQGSRDIIQGVTAEAFTTDGRSVDRPRVNHGTAYELPSRARRPRMVRVHFDRLTSGQTYKLNITADLGPVIGPLTWEQEYRMR